MPIKLFRPFAATVLLAAAAGPASAIHAARLG